ncbi:MAG: aldo/keto reductase [Clostridia bacterium]|nr:aldo/keto reductase [Clostridia bacterium]
MKYTDVAGKKLSSMSLGTVQLGMNYGIANKTGQPNEEKSFSMLRTALESGITSIDTARAYGTSEEVIGRFLKTWEGEVPYITTKVVDITGDNELEIERSIISCLEESLDTLGINKVNNVLLHDQEPLFENGKLVARAMEKLVKLGYTDKVGASVYKAEELEKMLEYDVYTSTQAPMSIFDQRLISSGMTDRLAERGITVFVRSVFLQGLFFLDPDMITDPTLIEHAVPKIRLLRECAEKEEMSIAELAISFMRDVNGVTSLVLGADNPDQVRANAAYFDVKPLSEETFELIKRSFVGVDVPAIMKALSRPREDFQIIKNK